MRSWLAGRGGLPAETRTYVEFITGRSVDDWAAQAEGEAAASLRMPAGARSCLELAAVLRRPGPAGIGGIGGESPFAPWGVQLAGNFSKALALASFARARQSYAAIIGEAAPMIIGTRLRSRGTRVFYRVRVPAATRAAADGLCTRIRAVGGSCIVLHS